jgi:hypothetical protein
VGKKISGLKTQTGRTLAHIFSHLLLFSDVLKTQMGRTLARIFSHLLLFSDVSIEASYIKGEKNTITDYLSRIHFVNNFSVLLLLD